MDVGTQLPVRTLPTRAVVTGHTGFIGGHLTARLADNGVDVVGFSKSTGGDLLHDEIPMDGVGHVFHLAALSYVPDSWNDPAAFHLVNTHGTTRVLEKCRRAGVSMTFVSTFVYAADAPMPVSEAALPAPANPYAFSKLAAEDACRFYARTFDMDITILRLFNTYGPGQSGPFLVPTIARQAVDPAVSRFRQPTSPPRRDFVHVDDVVDALVASARLPGGGTYNVGSGASHSVGDVIAACLNASGAAKPVRDRGEVRPNEVMDIVADISALTAATGWQPRIGFEAGIRSVIDSLVQARP